MLPDEGAGGAYASSPDQPPDGHPPGHRHEDELLQAVFALAPLGMVFFDAQLRIFRANTALAEMVGTTPEALVGRSFVDLIDPRDRDNGRAALARLERRELTWVTVPQRCLRDDARPRWGEFSTRVFWGPHGEFRHAFGIVRDITDAVTAEAALRESEIRNWRISESNMLGVVEWRDALTLSEANDAFLQMIGYGREDLRAGRIRWKEILPPDQYDLADGLRQELLTTGRIRPTRMAYLSRNGDRIPVMAGGARISAEPLRGIGFVLDMSGQVKVEEERARAEAALQASVAALEHTQAQLQLADRMASMGTLAAGVAHEINNPLGFVVANLGFAQDEVSALQRFPPEPEQLNKRLTALTWALAEAQEGANRVRNIVLDLRTFSHPDAEARTAVDVRRVLDSAVNMAQGEIRGRARIVRRFDRVPAVLANEARLSQVFLNLVVNAAHAIPAARTGETAPALHAPASGHEIRLSVGMNSDGAVQAEVTDTGVGIQAEHLPRIFDPFFTTKPIGRGTGLGLSICHGIVQSLGGAITVQSTPGTGTTFRVVLPPLDGAAIQSPSGYPDQAAAAPASPRPPARHVTPGPTWARARVLVVDDEPLMGSAISRVLAEHQVVALTSARAAMGRIAGGERFDVILCDVMMPDFSGIDLYAGIAREAPGQLNRLVYMTGGAYTAEAIDFLERVPNAQLEKPIMPLALHQAVAVVLKSNGPIGP